MNENMIGLLILLAWFAVFAYTLSLVRRKKSASPKLQTETWTVVMIGEVFLGMFMVHGTQKSPEGSPYFLLFDDSTKMTYEFPTDMIYEVTHERIKMQMEFLGAGNLTVDVLKRPGRHERVESARFYPTP